MLKFSRSLTFGCFYLSKVGGFTNASHLRGEKFPARTPAVTDAWSNVCIPGPQATPSPRFNSTAIPQQLLLIRRSRARKRNLRSYPRGAAPRLARSRPIGFRSIPFVRYLLGAGSISLSSQRALHLYRQRFRKARITLRHQNAFVGSPVAGSTSSNRTLSPQTLQLGKSSPSRKLVSWGGRCC